MKDKYLAGGQVEKLKALERITHQNLQVIDWAVERIQRHHDKPLKDMLKMEMERYSKWLKKNLAWVNKWVNKNENAKKQGHEITTNDAFPDLTAIKTL